MIFDARRASRIKRIDKDAASQAPEEWNTYLVKLLITSARAEMLFAFNENEKATSILRPILKAEVEARGAALNVSPAGISTGTTSREAPLVLQISPGARSGYLRSGAPEHYLSKGWGSRTFSILVKRCFIVLN